VFLLFAMKRFSFRSLDKKAFVLSGGSAG